MDYPEKITVEFKTNKWSGKPIVYLVWSGRKHIIFTHSLRCICTNEEDAIKRVDGSNSIEAERLRPKDEKDIEYWYDWMELDHMCGDSMLRDYTKLVNRLKTSE